MIPLQGKMLMVNKIAAFGPKMHTGPLGPMWFLEVLFVGGGALLFEAGSTQPDAVLLRNELRQAIEEYRKETKP